MGLLKLRKCKERKERKQGDNSIKILFVSHEAEVGGSSMSLISLIQGLELIEGMDITVMIPKAKGEAEKILKNNSINYVKVWYRRNFKYKNQKYLLMFRVWDLLNFIAVFKILFYIKREKFQLICSNSTGVDVGARAAKLAKIPHIYYVREFMDKDHQCEYRNKRYMQSLLECANFIIFISKEIRDYYCDKYRIGSSSVFFDGFLVKEYLLEEKQILLDKSISLIQVGAFSDGKGTLDTIDMLHYLKQNGVCNWNMEFIGRGRDDYRKKMIDRINMYNLNEQIIISDFSLNIREKLSSKDILIMNSISEGFGRVTVEGMLAGCLVLGKYLGGTKEIIINELNGISFVTKEEFLNIFREINKSRENYRILAKRGQEYAVKVFDNKQTAKNFYDVVVECLLKRQ